MFATQKPVALKIPEILTHPNIPKPLHGLNPRTLLGKEWWDKTRYGAQEDYDYCCAACGVPKQEAKKHQWLEGHEYWNIDYTTGICEVVKIVPLCHYCHNFIHSGRLINLYSLGKKPKKEVIEILEHGFKILSENSLDCFPGTLKVAERVGARMFKVKAYTLPQEVALPWNGYKLRLEGKLYNSLFRSYEEWEEYYSNAN